MKAKKTPELHFSVKNLIKIMNDRGLSKSEFATLMELPESKWNKISNGIQNLKVDDLSKIAEKLRIREIDILSYPEIYTVNNTESPLKAQITIELKDSLKDKVLSLIFNKNELELIKK
ncbi:MAG: helix-turn-helix transcriptional regulator [Clostridia bacterium]|nr:helix-turn-helix transcriptional regulator [Clostridia bacterium]